MPQTPLDENTLNILNIVSETPDLSQRVLADQSGLSLGLVNIIIKRLIKTGHIKISNLNQKKVQYFLTPKGFLEKTKQTSTYISKTIKTFFEYKTRLGQIIDDLVASGHRNFAVRGGGEIPQMLEVVFQSLETPVSFRFLANGEEPRTNEMLLDCQINGKVTKEYGVCIMAKLLQKSTSTPPVANSRLTLPVSKRPLKNTNKYVRNLN